MQEIDGWHTPDHCSVGDVDHVDDSRTGGVESRKLKPIVEMVYGIEIAQRRHRGRIHGLGEKRLSSEGVKEEGRVIEIVDIPQQVELAERDPIPSCVEP